MKIIFSPPKTRKAPSLWTKLRRKHTVGPLGSMQAIGGPFHWENEVSSVHQCHEWCEDEHAYVHRLFPLSSVQFSCSVVSNSLRPHEPQYARPPCPSPAPGVHPNPCLLYHQGSPFSPILSSWGFLVLCFILWSLDHFKLILVRGV